jgi:hypothetical protein
MTCPGWLAFQACLIHPDQLAYEEIRLDVALGREIKARAAEIGVSPKTLSPRVERFVQFGIPPEQRYAVRFLVEWGVSHPGSKR